MKLSDLLAALSSNQAVNITLLDANDNTLITFNATGYKVVDKDLGDRTVKRIKIKMATAVLISIDDAPEVEPDPDPTPDPDPEP